MKKGLSIGFVCSLILGGLIYLLFRAPSIKFLTWLDNGPYQIELNSLRDLTLPIKAYLPNWFLYSLPDGLWMFAYMCFVLLIWNSNISRKNMIWVILIPSLALLSEVGQLLGMVAGTYDINDLLLYFLGIILPIILFTNYLTIKKLKLT